MRRYILCYNGSVSMKRYSCSDVFTFTLLIAACFFVTSTRQAQVKRADGIHLAHVCVNLNTESEEGVPVIMLHGLTDIKETWDGIYQNISYLTHRRVCAYDARNHGDSSWNDTFNVDALAEDLGSFMHDMKIEKAVVVGHSMGGLTAMKFALKYPNKAESLFIEDISPIRIPEESLASVYFRVKFLADCLSVIPNDTDSDGAKKAVADYILKVTNQSLPAYFLNKNPLRQRDGVWEWKANYRAIIKALQFPDSFCSKMEGQYDGKVFFIYGKESSFKVYDDEKDIRKLFPNAEFFGVEGAGHGIHSQHPEFLRELLNFLM